MPWLVRILLLLTALQATPLPPLYILPGPQQSVQTEHPILCVHTRLTDEPGEWQIQYSLRMVREMGATAIVEFFPWAYIEPEQGRYHWEHSDLVIRHARAQGLSIIARLGLVPHWAQPEVRAPDREYYSLNYLTAEHDEDFAHFVEAFTRRYRNEVDTIILWNEPNLSFEWGYQPVDPQRYADLIRAAAPAAHRGNPDVKVLGGALAPTLEPEGSSFGLNDLTYLRRLYALGAVQVLDGLAVHAYGLNRPADALPAPDALNFRRVELIHRIMMEHGDEKKPVYITEAGWNDHPRWVMAVRPAQRIAYTLEALRRAETDWPWVRQLCLWTLRYPAPTHSYPDSFTLVTSDFTPKPIYDELQAWALGRNRPP